MPGGLARLILRCSTAQGTQQLTRASHVILGEARNRTFFMGQGTRD